MPAPVHKKLITIILMMVTSLAGIWPAHAEDDSYTSLTSHNSVSHSVAAFTGSAGASIPIEVPPGRNGIQPSLSLSYSSFARNGWAGVGWSLALGAIQRNTKNGLDYGALDFVDGDTELKAWPAWGGNAYRTQIESGFNQYYYDAGSDSWRVKAKDGRTLYYGSTAAARQSNSLGTFKWCLDRVEDPNGNYMTVTYAGDQGQLYPRRIEYTGHAGVAPYYYIHFYLENRTDPEISFTTHSQVVTAKRLRSVEVGCSDGLIRAYLLNYGASETTGRAILESVQLYGNDATVNADGSVTGANVIEIAAMAHADSTPNGIFTPPLIEWSQAGDYRYHNLVQLDADGDGAMDFAQVYCPGNATSISVELVRSVAGSGFEVAGTWTFNTAALAGPAEGGTWLGTGIPAAGDFNGDGRSDLLLASSWFFPNRQPKLYVVMAGENGALDTFYQVSIPCAATTPLMRKYDLADFNGDGRTDILMSDIGFDVNPDQLFKRICFSNGDGTFTVKEIERGDIDPVNEYHYVDMNGDGRADRVKIIKGSTEIFGPFEIAIGSGDGEFSVVSQTEGTVLPYARGCVRLGDFNGDGLMDLVDKVSNNDLAFNVFLNRGDGTFSVKHWFYRLETNGGFRTGDFNGDGKSDLLIYDQGDTFARVNVMFSNGDGTFGDFLWWYDSDGYYPWFPMLGDYNGDGRTDLVFHAMQNTRSTLGGNGTIVTLDPDWEIRLATSVAGAEGRLQRIENPLGGYTEYAYGPVAAYGPANLPYGLTVVTQTTTTEPINGLSATTRYHYAGGRHSTARGEFRGFAEVIATAPNGNQARTRFHQDFYRKGLSYEVDTYAPGDLAGGAPGIQLGHLEQTWEAVSLLDGAIVAYDDEGCVTQVGDSGISYLESAADIAFVKMTAKRSETYEDGDTPSLWFQEDNLYDDGNGNLETVTTTTSDPLVNPVLKTYENRNYGTWLWRRTGETIEEQDGGVWRMVRQVGFQHDSRGNLTQQTHYNDQGDDVVETFVPDAYGNTEYQTNPRECTTRFTYDATVHTYPVEVSTCAGEQFTVLKGWNYALGQPAWEQTPNQTLTVYDYDPFGRQEKVTVQDPYGNRVAQTLTHYHIGNRPAYVKTQVLETVDDDGNDIFIDTWTCLDGLGRTIQRVHRGEFGEPVVSRTIYDAFGRQTDTYGPFFSKWSGAKPDGVLFGIPDSAPRTWTNAFDERDRPLIVKTKGVTGALNYRYKGTATTVTDPDGAAKTTFKDANGRVRQVIEDPDGKAILTEYTYNAAGDLLRVDHLQGAPTVMTYNTLGQKRTMSDPDMGDWSYTYDLNGNLKTQTDANRRTIQFFYDDLDRVTLKQYLTPIEGVDHDVVYAYDDAEITLVNPIGRLSRVTNGVVTTDYVEYDALGRAVMVAKTITGDRRRLTTQDFDMAGKPVRTIYPTTGREVVTEYYPGTGLLKRVYTEQGEGDIEHVLYSNYEASGKIGTVLYGNGVQTQYDYNPDTGRLDTLLTLDAAQNNILDREYAFTPAGDLKTITDNPGDADERVRVYGYDALHRLTSEITLNKKDEYAYLTPSVMNYSYAPGEKPMHAVSVVENLGASYEFSYDNNGNLLSGPDMSTPDAPATRTIAYNSDNMPVSIVHSRHGTTSFAYDGTGGRAKKSGPSGAVYYISGLFHVEGGSNTEYIVAGSQRIAQVKNGQTCYFHGDHLGSAMILTGEDGLVAQQTEYLPYGGARGTGLSQTRYGFTGQEKDAETGLYNYNARLYDPALAVFVTADTIVPEPGSSQGYNRYMYCRGNPMILTDPSGHDPVAVAMIIGAVLGALQGYAQDHHHPGAMFTGALKGAAVAGVSAGAFESVGLFTDPQMPSSGIGPPNPPLVGPAGAAALHAAAGGLIGGMTSPMNGQSFYQGALIGGLSAGGSKFLGEKFRFGELGSPEDYAGRMAVGGTVAAITASFTGGNPLQSFAYSALMAGIAYQFNDLKMENWSEDEKEYFAGIALKKTKAERYAGFGGDEGYKKLSEALRSSGKSYDPPIVEYKLNIGNVIITGSGVVIVIGGAAVMVGGLVGEHLLAIPTWGASLMGVPHTLAGGGMIIGSGGTLVYTGLKNMITINNE